MTQEDNTKLKPKPPYRRRADASEYLEKEHGIQRSPKTLAKLACLGGGPPMVYDGRIPLYWDASLDVWAAEQLTPPVSSTAEKSCVRRLKNKNRHRRSSLKSKEIGR